MKSVFIKPRFNGVPLHKLYFELKNNPPDGYKIIIPEQSELNRFSSIASHNRNLLFKKFVYYASSIPYVLYQLHDNVKIPKNIDLVFAAQHIISSNKPWIVDVEHAGTLGGYASMMLTKKIILKKLKERYCKKILAWSEWSKRTIIKSFNDSEVNDKINVVRYTVAPKTEKVKNVDKTIRILFLGTINPGTEMNYEYKCLYETVSAFLNLQKEYKTKIHLIIRSRIPHDIKQKISKNDGITIYEKYLTSQEMKKLFLSCNIFPHVGYEVLNLSVLEAMSYGLAVIATDLFNTSEHIQNMKNGLLINPRNKKPFYTKKELPNERSGLFTKEMKKSREYMTNKLTESLRVLIEDENLRIQLGKSASNTIEDGEFSIKKRNTVLKQIFDESI